VAIVTDSDEYLVVEMQPRAHEAGFLQPGPLRPAELAESLGEWTTAQHRENINHSLVYHAGEMPPALSGTIAAADAFVAEVARRLRRPPQPHDGHPYWRGAIATVQAAAGGRLSPDAFRRLLGTPSRRGYWIERLRNLLMGYPPRVRPWHPRWPDYRPVLRRLAPFFADPARHLLHLSDAPTLFSLMLAGYDERVVRLQTSPFVQSAPDRHASFANRSDFCLVDLDQPDIETTVEVVRRAAPLMKGGGTILVTVREQQPMDGAQRFTDMLKQMMLSLHVDVRYVPASGSRAWSYRTFARLGTAAHQRPWVGLPLLALAALPLALFTLVLNLVAVARTRGTLGHRTASSVHVVMRTAK
jgi:hypothetical protein